MANTITTEPAVFKFKGKVPAAKLTVLEVETLEGVTTVAALKAAAECQVKLTGAGVKVNTKIIAYNEATKELTLSVGQTAEITSQAFTVPASLGVFQGVPVTGATGAAFTFTAGEWSTFTLTAGTLPAGLYLEEGPGKTVVIGGTPTAASETTGLKVTATATEGGSTAATSAFAIVVENSKFATSTVEETINTVDSSAGAVGSFVLKPGTPASVSAQAEVVALARVAEQGQALSVN